MFSSGLYSRLRQGSLAHLPQPDLAQPVERERLLQALLLRGASLVVDGSPAQRPKLAPSTSTSTSTSVVQRLAADTAAAPRPSLAKAEAATPAKFNPANGGRRKLRRQAAQSDSPRTQGEAHSHPRWT